MKSKEPIISLSNISKHYKTEELITPVLNGITLKVFPGDFVAITGPSGSGKSTLMNIIGVLDTATSGKYALNGTDIIKLSEDSLASIRNKEIGFVFQSFNLLNRTSVIDNVMLPAIYIGMKEEERKKHAVEVLSALGLADKLNNKPNQLSGGEQQRVAIARALMNNPQIILADEPTGNLDTKSGKDVIEILKKLNRQGKTIVLITHEPNIARQTKKIIRIRDGEII